MLAGYWVINVRRSQPPLSLPGFVCLVAVSRTRNPDRLWVSQAFPSPKALVRVLLMCGQDTLHTSCHSKLTVLVEPPCSRGEVRSLCLLARDSLQTLRSTHRAEEAPDCRSSRKSSIPRGNLVNRVHSGLCGLRAVQEGGSVLQSITGER